MKVIAVTGMPGSGKGEVLNFLKDRIPYVVMGDIVRDFTARKGLELTSENVGSVANSERDQHGMDIWAKRTIEQIDATASNMVLIDGIRGKDEIVAFKDRYGGDLKVIAVHASPRTRYARMSRRGRSDDPVTANDHAMRDLRELSWGIATVIALADHMIVNDCGLEELRKSTEELFLSFGPLDD